MPDWKEIPLEERSPEEVTQIQGLRLAPAGAKARNPAFDVTPHELISAIITEQGGAPTPHLPRRSPMCSPEEIIKTARKMAELGLVLGSYGNVSCRQGDRVLITPTKLDYFAMEPEDIVTLDLTGKRLAGGGSHHLSLDCI
jgi:hypothetical protein